MKLLVLTILASLTLTAPLNKLTSDSFEQVEDKNKCLPLLVFTALAGFKMFKAVETKNLDAIVLTGLDAAKIVWLDFRCLSINVNSIDAGLKARLYEGTDFSETRKECAIRHLKSVIAELKLAIESLK